MCIKDHKLGNLTIKKGTIVNVHFLSLMNNPKVYEKVEEFNPDRWL